MVVSPYEIPTVPVWQQHPAIRIGIAAVTASRAEPTNCEEIVALLCKKNNSPLLV
jgi:hypothetical protein